MSRTISFSDEAKEAQTGQIWLTVKFALFIQHQVKEVRPSRTDPPVSGSATYNPGFQVLVTYLPAPRAHSIYGQGGKGHCHRKGPWRRPYPVSTPWHPQNVLFSQMLPAKAKVSF